ncbi:flagellar hook assembly protein FlgD [Desulforamulus aeronauticus]|uniref:Flagellar basal-body rod modification protein FlgD n=1 Tax=Desulforamulus aeronauticus DSM 10349 TaxID=1121421 RepID=A0A1M6RCV0_9FIRM|nr:flagellar hook capping FlgD N-terminal domain-containing protein [Desulforamulus aeronauticus]SHK30168.1 flagellar basal-body rod modification protein FlgD [Desulforamulus aeronauticus DSM 10349]
MTTVNQTATTNSDYYYENRKREPKKELDKDAFLQLMVAQLRYQDPTSPMDTNKFTEQMAQFTTLEQITNLNNNFNKMYEMQMLSYGSSLMDCEVAVINPDNPQEMLIGVVRKVTFDSTGVKLWMGEDVLKPYDLNTVLSVERRAPNGSEQLPPDDSTPEGTEPAPTPPADETGTEQPSEPAPETGADTAEQTTE